MPETDRERRAVLITRPEPDASETAALVAARGFEPVVAPVLSVRPRAMSAAGQFDAVLVTSRNAVAALPATLHGVRLLAVGSATAARARAAGFADVLDAEGDADDLAALAARTLAPGSRLLFAHGSGQGDGLAAALGAAEFRVTRRLAYGTAVARALPAAAREALRSDRVRTATFLSAATARAFVRLVPRTMLQLLSQVDAATIGQPAADALAPLPFRRVRVSLKPTLDEVLALL